MMTSKTVRTSIIDALRLDLIGPQSGFPAHEAYAQEMLPVAPSSWYLTGFLVPYEAPASQRADDDGNETIDRQGRKLAGDDDGIPEEASARKAFFPSSIGLSVLVAKDTSRLHVAVAWGDYTPVGSPDDESPEGNEALGGDPAILARGGRGRWRRVPREGECLIDVSVAGQTTWSLSGDGDLKVAVSVRDVGISGLVPSASKSVSVFLVNHRSPAPDVQRDLAYVFQPELSLHSDEPLVARPDLHGQGSDDWDEKVSDLQYRDAVEFAVGHNVSALAVRDVNGECRLAKSTWMPTANVEKVVPRSIPGVQLSMEALANATSGAQVREMVGPMVEAYGRWIENQVLSLPAEQARRAVGEELLVNARRARERIQAGLDALDDPLIFEAFRIANSAIGKAIRQRLSHNKADCTPESLNPPEWRPFQLAFLLMNLVGTAIPQALDRKLVDLLFFPTGGGKTEAYLGLAAFVMVLRRLRDPSIQSAGMAVLMRYTLRLLTLDQLGRAATLVCALELERQSDVEKLGRWPFEIGLWVGQTATPNRMGRKGDRDEHSALARTIAFMNASDRKPSPIPLENCPWCGWKFRKDSFKLRPDAEEPTDLRVMCVNRACAFHSRKQVRGIPVLAVDEPIYRRIPAFLIATVDKFANLPWVGDTAGFFGRVERYDDEGFYGPGHKARGLALSGPLAPPDLIIQDELHLISGPLGTMVGLYETAVDALCASGLGQSEVRPKIVASTATVRRAERQIRALFGRSGVEVFPPPGPDRKDSFFAITESIDKSNPRTYLGVAAQGRNLKVVLLRTYLALMAAAQKAWKEEKGAGNPDNPADPYMTLLGYFNSLRELGGARRIVEDEVTSRLSDYAMRRRRVGESEGLFADRPRLTEIRELTSRVNTADVSKTKQLLELKANEKEHIDVALATNMISVGLDISRLGLMVVLGQPKTTSEYIQATSRVGRDSDRPGLVVTLLNFYRPRDRSHYERFEAWHESFYRAVEATSVTPFSPRAIDRGLAGVTVALARLGHSGMTTPRGALNVNQHKNDLAFVADVISRRAECHDAQLDRADAEALRKKVKDRVEGLLDAWANIATKKGDLQYQQEIGIAPPLLYDPLDPELQKQTREARQFKANRSLRDVEPTVNLWLQNPDGFAVEEDAE